MKLLREISEEVEFISERSENGDKKQYIEGIFLQGNIANRNGRVYETKILQNEVNRYVNEVVKNSRAYGELNHPSGPQINLDRVSHIIKELRQDGNNFIGKALITNTPMGNIAKGLMESGAKLGVSSRGMGSLKSNGQGIMEVQSDFRLVTAGDIVADPSAPNAFVEGIMENVEWIYDPVKDTWYEEKLHNLKNSIKNMSLSSLEEQKLSIFENYIQKLSLKQ